MIYSGQESILKMSNTNKGVFHQRVKVIYFCVGTELGKSKFVVKI